MNVAGRPQPIHVIRLETNGTMISRAGLTACSFTQIDPRRTAEAVTRNVTMSGGQRIQVGDTEYNEINLRLADGAVVPAKIILKDADLDLVLVAPVDPLSRPKPRFPGSGWIGRRLPRPCLETISCVSVRARRPLTAAGAGDSSSKSTIEGISGKARPCLHHPNEKVRHGLPDAVDSDEEALLGLCLAQIVDGHALMVGGHPSGIILATAEIAHLATRFASSKCRRRPENTVW